MSIVVWNVLLVSSLAGALDAELKQLDGSTRLGQIVSVSADDVVLATTAGEVKLSARELFSVEILSTDFEDEFDNDEDIRVELTDGSELRASNFRVEAGRATIDLQTGSHVRSATRTIRSVRFRKHNRELKEQWQAIAQADRAGDVLVLRKTNRTKDENGVEQVVTVLDSLEGALYDINDESIGFDYDGTRVDVSLDKVDGVIYVERGSSRAVEPVCRLMEKSGSIWNLKSLRMDGETLMGVTVSGVRATVPLDQLAKLDYSIGNLVFLSDLQPESVEWIPTVQTRSTPPSLKDFYRPQIDRGFFGAPLSLDGQSYEKGLAIHSRTVMQYRLTREFRRFAATVGLDSRFRAAGNITLLINGDGEPLFTQKIVNSDAPIAIDIDLKGVRRLTVTVDFGDDMSDIGDYLNLCNARLLK
ncbi:MAG: hypothetical protein CMJ64_11335 [Planctomycetaceae bacterium]|nr:hypothetical protein [Planctomycetaceae bacterium]